MAGRRDQRDLLGYLVVRADEIRQARLDDRQDGVLDVLHVRLARRQLGLPVVHFRGAEEVAGVGEARDPAVARLVGVPAAVVQVQVGADHRVDAVRRIARIGQVLEEGPGQVREDVVFALAVIADAGVDHDPPAPGGHDEGLEVHPHAPIGRGVMGREPVVTQQQLRLGVLEQHPDVVLEVVKLDDADDLHIADTPALDVFRRHVPSSLVLAC